jgi:hypothetical protein
VKGIRPQPTKIKCRHDEERFRMHTTRLQPLNVGSARASHADPATPAGDRRSGHGRASRGRRFLRARRRRRGGLLVGAALTASLAVGTVPARADISTGNLGSAMETVTCDTTTHSVRIDFDVEGQDSGTYTSTGFNDLFPHELIEPVYVYIWWWNGQWHHTDWVSLPNGSSASTFTSVTGRSYWYFQFAFMRPDGSYEYASEWAHGDSPHGGYASDGYNAVGVCNS